MPSSHQIENKVSEFLPASQHIKYHLGIGRNPMASVVLAFAFIGIASEAQSAAPPVPEILHYTFDESATVATNHASSPPVNAATATLMGGLTQNAQISGTHLKAVVGSGNDSSTDYVNTGWVTNLTGSWTISFFTSNVQPSNTLYYIMGDINANSLRIFTNGVAGPSNWILRGGGLTDVYLNGGAVVGTTMSTFVYDSAANEVRAYLNGTQVSTVSQPSPINISSTAAFKVVGYGTNVGLNAGGLLGDVRVYSKALTVAEIADIYTASTMLPQTLTFAAPPAVAVGGSAMVVATAASPNSGNVITYSTTSSDCSVSSTGLVTGITAGVNNCTITATQAGVAVAPGFEEGSATQVLSIAKAVQVINFTSSPPLNPKVGDSYPVAATGGGSGNAVVLAIDPSSSGVCSITGSTVTFNAKGICVVNANQTGDANYADAAQLQQTIGVDSPDLTIPPANQTLPGGQVGQAYSASIVVAGGVPPYSFTLTGDLPDGLTLNPATGAITGTPTKAQTSTFSVTIEDSTLLPQTAMAKAAVHSVAQSFSITIAAAPVVAAPTPVPTLGEWGVIALSSLLGMFGLARSRRR
ncbi:MAG: IPTL-CTERM sorting domain-containing protein [Burkholderiaceae bacterium]|jgi:hypothetical protein|nr:IPTL-CTERM sorting domain-containing protein [Burkholderiaceae bacterium]